MSEFINNVSKERKEALKKLIKRLHEGEDFESVKADVEKDFSEVSKVMWGVYDEIRDELKAVKKRLDTPGIKVADVKEDIKSLIHNVREMIFKENNILIPLLSDKLNLYNFITIAENSDEVGYFLDPPKKRFENPTGEASEEGSEENIMKEGEVALGPGSLSLESLNAMLNTLPLDLTFVDKEGYVKYFTTGEDRIFDRPATIIGRHVNQCHPPASVHVVEEIVNAFKSGKKDHEDFRIQIKDKFVHIRYFAVRNKDGEYLGTLEMTQDIAPLRAFEGEKRLISDD